MDSEEHPLVPEAYQRAAEEVRSHLVAVRGGAPFLSPADARLLVAWLEQGLAVSDIVRAIERAAEARRKARSRLPLTLGRVKVHLGKATPARHVARAAAQGHPLAAIAAQVHDRGAHALAEALLAIAATDPQDTIRAAVAHARAFLLQAWEEIPSDERARLLDEAKETLRALDLGHSEVELEHAAEELARDELRSRWPMLEASTIWDAVHGGPG